MDLNVLKSNAFAEKILKNEILQNKKNGTYLFFSSGKVNLFDYAMEFAMSINCEKKTDKACGECRNCKNIQKKVYSDLYIYDAENNFGIDDVRDIIYNASNTGYEAGKKIFIIQNINVLKKESANAMLKTIEEPPENTFFILTTKNMNIISTIKSRSIIINFYPPSYKELEVSKEIYSFFDGNTEDIAKIKNEDYDYNSIKKYDEIFEAIELYIDNKDIKYKADIIKCIKNYINSIKFLNSFEKIEFADKIEKKIGKERILLKEILNLFIINLKDADKTEKLLEIKNSIMYNVNISNILYSFFVRV